MTNTSSAVRALFQPFSGGGFELTNRIVMAPMTRGFSPGGVPGDDVAAYYRRRAENGVGLIVTEGTLIDHPAAGADRNVPNFCGEEALNGWKRVVDSVHEAGGRIIPQIWHVGTMRNPANFPDSNAVPIGPSGLSPQGEPVNEPLTEKEIAYLIDAYARAAGDAKRLGFDGVELHGAHGYLIDQFFWSTTNKRTDRYGGADLAERTRFAVEVIEAVRRAVGPDFPIVLRLSQWKPTDYSYKHAQTPQELEKWLAPLSAAGVDVFHASSRRFWQPEFADSGSDLNLAGWTKKITGKPSITVGSVGLDNDAQSFFSQGASSGVEKLDGLLERLDRGEFDLVAVGRALLADPAWAAKVRDGREDELVPFKPESTRTLY